MLTIQFLASMGARVLVSYAEEQGTHQNYLSLVLPLDEAATNEDKYEMKLGEGLVSIAS